ncbi:hypothetical protein BKI52_35970 [marine bacterium AO1-C]|nr:hypothetical protein BKI52_35970 [marine bacterium AO1-C]
MIKLYNRLLIATLCAFMIACGGNTKNENTGDSTKNDTNTTNDTSKTAKQTPPRPKTPKDFLCQKWGYDAQSFVDALVANMPAENRSQMTEEQKKGLATMAENAFYQFNLDGTYAGKSPAGLEVKGTWSLSADYKILTIRETGVDKADIRVLEELSAEKLVWKLTQGEQSLSFAMLPFTEKTSTEKQDSTTKK